MTDWKTVTVKDLTFTRRIVFCPLDEKPFVLDGIPALAAHFEDARRRRKYGWGPAPPHPVLDGIQTFPRVCFFLVPYLTGIHNSGTFGPSFDNPSIRLKATF